VTTESEELAAKAGLPMSFSLGSTAPLADSVKTYQRALIMDNPTPEMINQEMLEFLNDVRAPYKQRKSFYALIWLKCNQLIMSNLIRSSGNFSTLLMG
jgi:hypothetical protein